MTNRQIKSIHRRKRKVKLMNIKRDIRRYGRSIKREDA